MYVYTYIYIYIIYIYIYNIYIHIYINQSLVFDWFLYKLSLRVSRRNVCERLDSKENFSSYNIFVVAFTVAM